MQHEKVFLIGININEAQLSEHEAWTEFVELVAAAGGVVVGRLVQPRTTPDPSFFLGSGKAEFLAEVVKETEADLVIALQELTASQVRHLEELTGVRVIDRTNLILDIFAQRARNHEGKLQVELAQLNYLLPRLGRAAGDVSRSGGGIGTKGPGETPLEVDRRRVRERIIMLKRELESVVAQRAIQRHQREKQEIPTIALVGYTNAGKSTLFNALTAAGISAADRLFDTLEPVARQLPLPNHQAAVLIDTVGFVSNLPHQLVAAFRSTLEETVRADLLVVVLDSSTARLEEHYDAVKAVLVELEVAKKEMLIVLNKIDLLPDELTREHLVKTWSGVPISAKTGQGLPELLAEMVAQLKKEREICRLLVPFGEAGVLNYLHTHNLVQETNYVEQGIELLVELEPSLKGKYAKYLQLFTLH